MNRRELIKTFGAAAAALTLSPFLPGLSRGATPGAGKKILFFTKSSGFQHNVITRKSADELAYAEVLLKEFAGKAGFDVTVSKDGSLFTPEYLAKFDALAFYTTGDLTKDSDKYKMIDRIDPETKKPMKDKNGHKIQDKGELLYKEPGMGDAGKAALLDAIKGGKGFISFHCGSDTFHSKSKHFETGELLRDKGEDGKDAFDPYIRMLGGEFITHRSQQPALLKCVDGKFPGAEGLNNAKFKEEWYCLKNFSPDLHVILVQDCQGMIEAPYHRQPYPETWARLDGKGRVFYTSMGHKEEVWAMPEFQALTIGALRWATGQIDVDVTPNLKEVAPGADPLQWQEPAKK